jgi:tRNA 2-thiouridine synthesizing protein A
MGSFEKDFGGGIGMSVKKADSFVDITDVVCPITFVKAKVAIEELDDGQILKIRMNEGEPIQNVPRSLKEEGHKVIEVTGNEDGTFTILVEKGGLLNEV